VEWRGDFNIARQYNRGIIASTGDLIICMNDDVVVEGDWIPLITERLVGNYGITGAEPITVMDTRGRSVHQPKDYDGKVLMVEGYFMVIKRWVFDRIGLFDEKLGVFYQDADFCFRAWQAGIDVVSCPNLPIRHLRDKDVGKTVEMFRTSLTPRIRQNARYIHEKWGIPLNGVFTLEWAKSLSRKA